MTQSVTVNNNWPTAIEERDNLDYWLKNRPTESYVFTGDYYFPLRCLPASVGNKQNDQVYWLGRSKVILSDRKATFPEHNLTAQATKYESEPLRQNINRFLYEAKAAPLDNRIPVLTYGSNTNPQQLDYKFDEPGINKVIPLVKCKAKNLEVVFSAHQTKYGFIAPTLIELDDAEAEVFVAFHSREQLEHIRKELTNDGYCFRHFKEKKYRLCLDNYNNYLDEYYAFLPEKRALFFSDAPRRVAHIKHSEKNEMLHTEIEHKEIHSSVPSLSFIENFRARPGFRSETIKADIYSNIKVRSIISELNTEQQTPKGSPAGNKPVQKLVQTIPINRNTNNRIKGDYNIYLPPSININSPQVILTKTREGTSQRLLVKTTKKTSAERDAQSLSNEASIADVDLTIRNALGIEVGESLHVEEFTFKTVWKDSLSRYWLIVLDISGIVLVVFLIHYTFFAFATATIDFLWRTSARYWLTVVGASLIDLHFRRLVMICGAVWGRWILRPIIPDNYLIMRMTPAAKLFEREACAMPEIAFDLLGIETGDKVVLEAVTENKGKTRVKHCIVRAYKRDEISLNTAVNLSTDDPDSVFADCSEILDVFPDIEPIIINYDLRKRLGLENQKCAPIRVRISKRYRLAKEFRNGIIAILLVLVGTLSLFEDQQVLDTSTSTVIFVISLAIIAMLSFWALRERLSA